MSILQQIEDQLDGYEVAKACIADVLRAFDNQLQENELSKLEIPTAVSLAMAKIEAMVKVATVQYDGETNPVEFFEKMDPDAEPLPTVIDSWARGSVATRKVVPELEGFRKAIPDGHNSNTPSISSYRSGTLTGRSRTTTGTKSRAGTALTKTSEIANKTGQIFDLEEDDLDKEFGQARGSTAGTGFMFETLQKMKKKKDPDYFFQSQDGEEKGEFDLLQDQITKAAKDMRGKAFVLDRYGQPVPLGKVNIDNLPPFTVSPASSIVESSQAGAGRRSPKASHEKENKDRKVLRVAGSRGIVYEGGFEPNLSLAVTLGNINAIEKIDPGVAISSSNQRRSGENFPEDPKHVSKKVYFTQTNGGGNVSPQASMSLHDGSVSFVPMGSVAGGGPGSPSQFSSQFSDRPHQQGSLASKSAKANSRKPIGGVMKLNTESVHSLDSLPDVDPMLGSQPLQFVDAATLAMHTSDDDSAGRYSPQRLPQKPSHVQKRSIELLRGGMGDKGIPRDRDLPQNTRNIVDRKHLPAPPIGFTTGHGLDMVRVMEQLSAGSADSFQSAWHQQWRN